MRLRRQSRNRRRTPVRTNDGFPLKSSTSYFARCEAHAAGDVSLFSRRLVSIAPMPFCLAPRVEASAHRFRRTPRRSRAASFSGPPGEEIRGPLLQKGADAFDIIIRSAGLALQIALEVELRVEACFLAKPRAHV